MATFTLVLDYYPCCFLVSRFEGCVGERTSRLYICDNILPLRGEISHRFCLMLMISEMSDIYVSTIKSKGLLYCHGLLTLL
jgi:hypothetical protein